MSTAQLVITAVVLEGRSKTDVARDYDVSRQWVHQLITHMRPRGQRRLSRAHADRTAMHAPSAPMWKSASCGCVKP
jgi:transposase